MPGWPPRVSPGQIEALKSFLTLAGPDRDVLPVRAPFTDTPFATIPQATEEDVVLAVERARRAQQDWARRSVADRAAVLARLHDLVLAQHEEILDLVQFECGKARRDAFEELGDVAIVARYYAYHGGHHLRPRRRRGLVPGLTVAHEHRHSYGVVGLITPWNYPLTLAVTDALPALLAGNAVVVKPAEQTTFTALRAAQLFRDAGLPADLFQVVSGRGEIVGPPLIGRVDFVGFTGSTEVGRLIARQAAERLIPCSLELGGKNPMLVLEDADLDLAVEGAVRGCFANAGQLCISFERLLVARSIFEPFTARLTARVDRLKAAPTYTFDADLGSLISREHLAKVEAHVEDARRRGATVLAGGCRLPDLGPLFYAPTLVTDVPPEARMAREETFGPVVGIAPFDTEEEAIARANDSPYGLNASVWTRDARRGAALACRIQAGTVGINDPYQAAWGSTDAPMGGFKESGLGRRHGRAGIDKYLQTQTVAQQRLHPIAMPEGISYATFARWTVRLLHLLRRLPGLR